jgi:hypothetical protein
MATPSFLRGGKVTKSDDLDRILALPKRDVSVEATEALAAEMTELLRTPPGTCRGCKACKGTGEMHLRPLQALALLEAGDLGGGFFPLRVGYGKSIIALISSYVLDAKRPLLLNPAGLITKTEKERSETYGPHFIVPKHVRVFSYEKLGRADYANELEDYPPDLIVADEAHKLKNPDAAVTKRLLRYMENHPETMFIALSGTIMDHSLLEFAHILRWCLKGRAPVPLSDHELAEWASALDVKAPRGNEYARYDVGALTRLADGVPGIAANDDTTRARLGFRHRLISTPGIVATAADKDDVKASIRIRGIVYAPTSESKDPGQEDFQRLRGEMKLTDDWELTTPMEVWAHARQVALDLTYIWSPRPPDAWIDTRKAWTKFIRDALKESTRNGGELDSPLQVRQAVESGHLPGGQKLLEAWLAERDRLMPDTGKPFTPNVVPVWHGDLALKACAKWARTSGPGIIWTEHTLFARRLAEKTGLKYYGQGGYSDDGEFIDDADPKRSVIASADANKEGRNLQHNWSKNLITCLEERPGKFEQMIGRTHRSGQQADEVTVDVLIGCMEHLNAWRRLVPAAQAVKDTTGAEQKVLLAYPDAEWPSESEIATWTGARWVPPDDDNEPFDVLAAHEEDLAKAEGQWMEAA